jgi:hypothetical protein
MLRVEQELLILPEHNMTSIFSFLCGCLLITVCSMFFWPLYCLSVINLRLLITTLVSSISSFSLKGDNSLKSVERFDHMMFVCKCQASRWSKPQREKLLCGQWINSSESVGWNLLKFWYLLQWIYSSTLPTKKNKKIKRADQILPEVYGTTLRLNLFKTRLFFA